MAQCWNCGSEMSGYASRCNECGRSTTLSAFFQVGSLGVLIVAGLMVAGVMPASALGFLLPRGWEWSDSPLPKRTATAEASVAGGSGGGSGLGQVFGYGASGQAAAAERERDRGAEEGPGVSDKGASRDPACDSEGSIRRLAERHPNWDRFDLTLIACDRVRVGFTGEQVQASLGRPLRRQTARGAAAEVWIYRDTRLVLERDRVVSIRE